MTASLHRLGQGLLAAFILVALAAGYWGLIRRDELLAREDNPRSVLEERRIQRGQIVDRNGVILAETVVDVESGLTTRHYPHPETAPAVGYYSLRYGVGGIEAEYDALLRGEAALTPLERLTNRVLHRPQIGGDVQLTLDLAIQQAAEESLAEHKGAIIVMSVPQGEILAMSSHPTFDANRLDEDWDNLADNLDAPLLNRATQGVYQPGAILQSVVLGAALNTGLTTPTEVWSGDLTTSAHGTELPCAEQQRVGAIMDAFIWACPAPFTMLAERLGASQLDAALSDFGLLNAPTFTLPAEAADFSEPPAQDDLYLTAIGQSELTVSPLQMVLVAAAFANHGQMPAPRLVLATRAPDGDWGDVPAEGHSKGAISPVSADTVAELMWQAVVSGAARAAMVPEHSVYGHTGFALSGPEGTLNAWFIGFVHLGDRQTIAIAVLIEDVDKVETAAQIGGHVLRAALKAQQ